MASTHLGKANLLKKTNVIAKDYIGLRHNSSISSTIISRESEVDKDGNETVTDKEI